MAFVPLMTTEDEASAPRRSGYFYKHGSGTADRFSSAALIFFSVYRGLKTSVAGPDIVMRLVMKSGRKAGLMRSMIEGTD